MTKDLMLKKTLKKRFVRKNWLLFFSSVSILFFIFSCSVKDDTYSGNFRIDIDYVFSDMTLIDSISIKNLSIVSIENPNYSINIGDLKKSTTGKTVSFTSSDILMGTYNLTYTISYKSVYEITRSRTKTFQIIDKQTYVINDNVGGVGWWSWIDLYLKDWVNVRIWNEDSINGELRNSPIYFNVSYLVEI